MDYVGIDPVVGLECSECKHVSRVEYSGLLDKVMDGVDIHCHNCNRKMVHDWSTVTVVQNIIKKRMQQANQAKERRTGTSS